MKKSTIAFAILLTIMAVMFVINLFFGSIHLDASEVMDALLGKGGDSVTRFVVVESHCHAVWRGPCSERPHATDHLP